MIKLSIIVPIYKVAQYLCKCVDSLLAQDIPAFEYEIILVDDGSPDECPKICDTYADIYDNIHVVHRENGGLSAARNTGIEAAKGEYIQFVDSDDYIEPNVLGRLMRQIENDNLDVLRYKIQYVNPQYEVYNPYKSDPYKGNVYSEEPTDGVAFLNTRMSTACYVWQFIIKRCLIVDSRKSIVDRQDCLFTTGIYFEDTDWTPRMLVRAKRVASTDTVVYNYLQREGSITNAVNKSKQKKVLDDKMRLIGSLQKQSTQLKEQHKDNRWFDRVIAANVISIIGVLSRDFYEERKAYIRQLKEMNVFPLKALSMKARLINFCPKLMVCILHVKSHR